MKTEIGIVTIGCLQGLAMVLNKDGATLMPVVAVIGALVGYHIRPIAENIAEATKP